MKLKRLLGSLRESLANVIVRERIYIYHLPLPRQAEPGSPQLDPISSPEAIVDLYRAVGHRTTIATVRRRLSRHLDCFRARSGNDDIGLTWIQRAGNRYIDELGLGIPLPPRAIWGRDAFVRNDRRGTGHFRQCLSLLHAIYPDVEEIWSDVDAGNRISRAAHEAVGFKMRYIIGGWRIAGLLIVRTQIPPTGVQVTGFRPDRSVIFLGPRFRAHHEAHIT